METAYNPKTVEDRIYKFWEDKGYFHAQLPNSELRRDRDSESRIPHPKTPFSIVIPPPNVTGILHMGHVMDETPQDILVRFKRMQGFATCWVPGTDHAGIATQNAVEKQLKKDKSSRHALGRTKFVERVWQWKEEFGNTIILQLKKLGCSCDWSRLRFTMDEAYSSAVIDVFIRLYEKGLIYRGKRVVNWCPRCQTSLSDLEIEYKEEKSKLWFIKYPVVENQKSEIRNPKQARNPKSKRDRASLGIRILKIRFCFEFRVSSFYIYSVRRLCESITQKGPVH